MKTLATYACDVNKSLGRLNPEAESPTRTAYARDRDRIIHSTAFRRLKGKTQVFVANEGDYFRTRLTHSLEVAQVARSLAHSLNINEDLAETIALSHDLGHPPFGHAGEDELHACMSPWGGYDHNVQTFRVITRLEVRYPAFDGLNLTWETLEGIVKHNGPVLDHMSKPSWKAIVDFNAQWDLRPDSYASLEAQAAAIADDIAYNSHDIDDGLRAGLFSIADLMEVPLIGPALASVQLDWPGIDQRLWRLEAVRRMLGTMMSDVLVETQKRIRDHNIVNAENVRSASSQTVAFSATVLNDLSRLRGFLHERMYKHYTLNRTRSHAKRTLHSMFGQFMSEPNTLPVEWYQRVCSKDSETARARVICDYIAGMTDAFAIEEHRRLFSFNG